MATAAESPENPLFIAFVDTETTGLELQHEIIEIAVVQTDWTLAEQARVCVKVKPSRLEIASPAALAINGYTEEAWKDALDLEEALTVVLPYIHEATYWGGHNTDFDLMMLAATCRRAGKPVPAREEAVDTWRMARSAGLPKQSLDAVCGFLDIERQVRHQALADALASVEVARRFRKYRMALLQWPEAIRSQITTEIGEEYRIKALTVADVVGAVRRDAVVRQYAWVTALELAGVSPVSIQLLNQAIIDRWGAKARQKGLSETAALEYIKAKAWRLLAAAKSTNIEVIGRHLGTSAE